MKLNNSTVGIRGAVPLVLLVGLLSCSREATTDAMCRHEWQGSVWIVQLFSEQNAYHLSGELRLDGDGLFSGTGTSRDGAREPFEYALDEANLGQDSVYVRFAPAEVSIVGRCNGTDTIPVTFSMLEGAIEGSGELVYSGR